MADTRKGQEREELHRAIRAIADELRGSVDNWDFKSYALGTMFYRYISEKLTEYINAGEIAAGNDAFDYAQFSDMEAEEAREGLVTVGKTKVNRPAVPADYHARSASRGTNISPSVPRRN